MAEPLINSYTNWGPLKEVWLGDVYPASWYDHLEPEIRDCFYKLTEITKQDLDIIQKKLEDFGVHVVRPRYNRIDDYIDGRGNLIKPQITPRDNFLVYGNQLIYNRYNHWRYDDNVNDISLAWRSALSRYRADPNSKVTVTNLPNNLGVISSANSVRAGRDIYLDVWLTIWAEERKLGYEQHIEPLFRGSRVHLLSNGGHIDGCFSIIKPGLMLTNHYFTDYDKTFPGWQQIRATKPEFENHIIENDFESMTDQEMLDRSMHLEMARTGRVPMANPRKFFLSGPPPVHVSNPKNPTKPKFDKSSLTRAFNEYVVAHALDWVGDYTETFFETNCLVVDEKNVLMMGENPEIFRALEQHGVTPHNLPFRARTFWDGGLHCLTLDIRRDDSPVDLFPERDQELYQYY